MVKRRTQGGSSSNNGRGRKAHRSSKKAETSKGDAMTAHDVFEADEIEADEDAHAYRYDDVENNEYELPDDFEDEEIEEDEAFNSEDERLYGHLFDEDNSSEVEDDSEDDGESQDAYDALESDDHADGDESWPDIDEVEHPSGDDANPQFDEDITQNGTDEMELYGEEGDLPDAEGGYREKKQLLTEAYPESVFHISAQGMCILLCEKVKRSSFP